MRLAEKIALVTGAAQGIGRTIALSLAKEGAAVVVADINLEQAGKVANEVEIMGGRALAVRANVADYEDARRMVEEALRRFGRIDILVNNAAPSDRGMVPIEDTSEDIWKQYMDIILNGTFFCSKAVGKSMISQGGGKIVNIASTAAQAGYGGKVAYSASKAGVISLTKTFALEWGKHNINVNAVSPSVTVTAQHDFMAKEKPGRYAAIMRHYPLKRFNQPEDIANVVLFLASPEADNITGQEITVDSGAGIVSPAHVWPEEV